MKKKTFKGYICSTAVRWELGETDVKVYDNIESLKRHNKCHKECGITELTIMVSKEITQGRLSNEKTNRQKAVPDSDTKKSQLQVESSKRSIKKS